MFTAGFPPAARFGGLARTLAALIDAQSEGMASITLTSDRDLDGSGRLPVTSNSLIGDDKRGTYFISTNRLTAIAQAFRLVRRFHPDVIYVNSFFEWLFSIVPQLAHAVGFFGRAQMVIAPRGEFSSGALGIKTTKKRIYLRLYSILRLHRHVIWHASTDRERRDIARVIGPSASIVIREDETHLPDRAEPPPTNRTETLTLAFLSRISEKKGLHTLLESLAHTHEAVSLQAFGFVEDPEYFARCEALARRLPPHVTFAYGGPVEPGDVRATFAAFDVFAFPTAGENFGHVIAESLSVSCPVMCADTTPWTRYIDARGGGVLVSSLDPVTWAAAIDRYARLSAEERLQRRKRAGDAFDDWRREDKGEHVFDLVRPFVT